MSASGAFAEWQVLAQIKPKLPVSRQGITVTLQKIGTTHAQDLPRRNIKRSVIVIPINDRPDPDAIMVPRAKADDDQIVAAAGRGLQCHADAEALIAAGDAVGGGD